VTGIVAKAVAGPNPQWGRFTKQEALHATVPPGGAMSNLQRGFQQAGGPALDGALVRWLEHADALPSIQAIKHCMLALGPIGAGDSVLDVGCGIGLETARLAERTGPTGRVAGVDTNAAMVAEASRRARNRGVPVEYKVMGARRLEFAEGAFDLCRAERVLRYVEGPERAVQEMARVVHPGGRVVVFDFDSDATVIDAPDLPLVRRIREVLDAAVPNCWMGRQLPRLFREAGLVDIAAVPQVVMLPSLDSYRRLVHGSLDAAVQSGNLAADDLARWWSDLERTDREGGILAANLGFVVHGRRPTVHDEETARWR
jgi:ubiquinone/menaquinone biosynthesis C-methylase UbiE